MIPTVIPSSLPSTDTVYPIPSSLSTSEYLRLFTAYINSQCHPHTFLTLSKYPNPENKTLQRRLHSDLREHLDSYDNDSSIPPVLLLTVRAPKGEIPDHPLPLFEQILDGSYINTTATATGNELTLPTFTHPESLSIDPNLSPSDQITLWRSKLSFDDWQSAQYLRQKVMQVARTITPDTFKPADIRSIAATLADIQKIQRMALGLPSEQLGFKMDGKNQDGEDLPIINVMIRETPILPPSSSPSDSTQELVPPVEVLTHHNPPMPASVVDGELESEGRGGDD